MTIDIQAVALVITGVVGVYLFVAGFRSRRTPQDQEEYIMKWLSIVEKIAPVAAALIPGFPPVLVPAIVKGIGYVEEFRNDDSSKAKLNTAVEIVKQTVEYRNQIAAGADIDPAQVETAVRAGISAVVDATNAVHAVQNAVKGR